MTWERLAVREARVHAKKIGTWAIALVAFGFFLLHYSQIQSPIPRVLGADGVVLALQPTFGIVLLIGGLLLGHRVVLDERTTGRIKLTASMPHSRRDIIIGKLVGLSIPLVAMVVVLLFVSVVVAVATTGVPSFGRLLVFGLISVVYAVVCVTLGVAISAVVTTFLGATGGMLATLVGIILWQTSTTRLYARLTGISINVFQPPADGLLFLVRRLDPRSAYLVLTNWVYDAGNAAGVYSSSIAEIHAKNPTVTNTFVVDTTFEHPPSYLAEPLSIIVLLVWLLPLVVAVRTFDNADIS